MRDLNQVQGPKQKVEWIEDALKLVRERYPTATKEGSLGSYSFWVGKDLVGEAWIRSKWGWWLRIAETPVKGT